MQGLVRRAGLEDAIGGSSGTPTPDPSPCKHGEGRDREAPSPKFLHVAGTNGKGAVTAYMQSILAEAGVAVGGFYSPYVYDIRERVQLGRELISKEDLALLTAELAPIADSLEGTEFGGVTEFEFKTALGFAYWKRKRADWVALEVGLGGRLDATNVVTPCCSVIVSIGLDHTEHLGSTLAEIAREKAGIVKPGVPLVLGSVPEEAEAAILSIAHERGSPVWKFGREILLEASDAKGAWDVETPERRHSCLHPGLFGRLQPHNMALAVAALDAADATVSDEAVRAGAERTRLPGRFERTIVGQAQIVLDGAHNAEAAVELAETMRSAFPGRSCVLLTGMVAGHDVERFYRPLAGLATAVHVSPIEFNRARPSSEIAGVLRVLGMESVAHDSASGALEAALQDGEREGLLLVTGSFYLVGKIGNLLRAKCGT